MANPDYASLLAQIAAESDSSAKQVLINQCYVFETTPSESDQNLFNYMSTSYVETNPGLAADSSFSGYVGVYYNDAGATT